ncbi:hypothetical protein TanjilG_11052 [Lupinus angustifolius]|uniref:Uncharacterized protein n=1 Tax=Lupinus angustifolius TaxID=3871 RepID=A0A1J7I4H8_LUPAN|nr:hypothetical protein TanjilG_11052 [Lupinus angustifolius]
MLLPDENKEEFDQVPLRVMIETVKLWLVGDASMMRASLQAFSETVALHSSEYAKEHIRLNHPDDDLSWMSIDGFVDEGQLFFEKKDGTVIELPFLGWADCYESLGKKIRIHAS